MWPGYHKIAQSGQEMVTDPFPCEQGDHSGETALLNFHGKHQSCWRHSKAELCDSDLTSLGYVRCFQVTYWMVLHQTRKPSPSSWHIASPDVALNEAKTQRSSEPSEFKRFGTWSSACGSKWKCIHDEQTARFFKLLMPIGHARLYLAVLHLHRATWTCIKTIPLSSFASYCLVQQQIVVFLTGKITADKCKVFWFGFFLSSCKCMKIYLEHFMGTLHTWWKNLWLLPLWAHQKHRHLTSLFLSTLLMLDVHSGLDFFFPEYLQHPHTA